MLYIGIIAFILGYLFKYLFDNSKNVKESENIRRKKEDFKYCFLQKDHIFCNKAENISVELSEDIKNLIDSSKIIGIEFWQNENGYNVLTKILDNGIKLIPEIIYECEFDGMEDSSYKILTFGICAENGNDVIYYKRFHPRTFQRKGEGKDWAYETTTSRYKIEQFGLKKV